MSDCDDDGTSVGFLTNPSGRLHVCPRQDIPTGADSCVTSLSCDSQRSLIVAGLGDGSVRVFDKRMGPNEW